MRELLRAYSSGAVHADLRAGAVELWLHNDLAARYDATLREAVPADLLALVNTLKH